MSDTEVTPATNAPAPPANGNGKRKRILSIITLVIVLIGAGWFVLWLIVFSQRTVTDDAYVGGNQVVVSSQVPGTVIAVMADDTQRVEAGQVLVKLDPTDTEVDLARARNALALAVREVRGQVAGAGQADAAVEASRIQLALIRADLKRREPLLEAEAVSPETLAHLNDQVKTAQSSLRVAERRAAAAHAAVDGTDVAHNPAVLQARAVFRQAWLAAHRTAIVAPVSGYVAERGVQVGQQIAPGQPLMQVIALRDLWIDANFKESQLEHIRIGQPVEIRTEIYGGDIVYHGTVEGLGAGTGGAFSLLPAQNASGNWIKVVQRVPVRIRLEPEDLEQHPLRIGLSTEATVDTHDRGGKVLAETPASRPVAATGVYKNDFARAEAEADAIVRANLGTAPADAAPTAH